MILTRSVLSRSLVCQLNIAVCPALTQQLELGHAEQEVPKSFI
jgi:hypothetical protein